jgi:Tripartite tricarboxylate transporter family receptor
MKRRTLIAALAAALTAGTMGLVGHAEAAYPDRPLTLIVPWGAGGGTDATARIVASILEKEIGQPINVVNRTGGSGVVGHSAIAEAEPDGYTLGIATVEIGMMHWQGLTELTSENYTPLALVNEDPAAVTVRVDAAWNDLNALIEDVKANPGKYKASGTGQGGIWHLALAGLLSELEIDPAAVPWVPSEGAAPGLQDLVAGGVDIVPASIPEARAPRRRPGEIAGGDVGRAQPRLPGRADHAGDRGRHLGDRRLARHRRPEGPAGGGHERAHPGAGEGLQQRRIQGLHVGARLRHALGRRRRFRRLHEGEQREPGRGDEGRRARQIGEA